MRARRSWLWTLRSVLADVLALALIGHWLQGCCDSVDLLAVVASNERDDRRMLRWLSSQMSCHPSHPSSFTRPAWHRIASHPQTLYTVRQLRIEEELLMFGVCSSRSGPAPLIAANWPRLISSQQPRISPRSPRLVCPPSTASHPIPY